MVKTKINNPEVTAQVLKILQVANQPVSTGYVAYHLDVCWSCAKEILLSMALEGKIAALSTSKGFIFTHLSAATGGLWVKKEPVKT